MSTTRTAACRCGSVTTTCTGEPVRVSVCHCLDCKRRSGSAFAAQARWPDADVTTTGETHSWSTTTDSGSTATFRFCPKCGTQVAYTIDSLPDLTAIPTGTFADPNFPPPQYSVYESRKHAWLEIVGEGIERF